MAFALSMYPWVYRSRHLEGQSWSEEFEEKPHASAEAEAAMDPAERAELMAERNSFPELPLINYTTQYGLGCFEGLKAYPQSDGSLALFRPDRNAARMHRSMEGLQMPPFPEDRFVKAVTEVVRLNKESGFAPAWDDGWEQDDFVYAASVYIRPFSYSEAGIGLNLSSHPYVVIITTPVTAYFDPKAGNAAVTTRMIRATPHGTGWIKCAANYVIPILAKKQGMAEGYMEVIFLDSLEHKWVEEGSSCNIFFVMKGGHLVTPELADRVLPGINRMSVLELARKEGVPVEERPVSIEEVMDKATECFVTGTAAGVTPIGSITHNGRTNDMGNGELSHHFQTWLRGIQYGVKPDEFGWMHRV